MALITPAVAALLLLPPLDPRPVFQQDSAAVYRRLGEIQQQMSTLQRELLNLNEQFGAVHQEFSRLQKDSDPQRLPQRLARLEEMVEKLEKEVSPLQGMEEKLKRDLPWEIFSRLVTIGTVLLSAMLALIGYFLSKQFVYQYLKENGIFDKLADKALREVVPKVVEEVKPQVTEEAAATLMEYVGKFLRENTDLTGTAVDLAAQRSEAERLEYKVNGAKVLVEFGDITEQSAQAIVSSDDTLLHMAGGVAKRILDVGGPEILSEAQKRAPIALGEVAVTNAGRLQSKFVFHPAVIDISAGKYPDDDIIGAAVRNCFKKAAELGVRSLAFPAIGAGTGGFSAQRSAEIILQTAREILRGKTSVAQVSLVIYKKQHLQEQPRKVFDRIFEMKARHE